MALLAGSCTIAADKTVSGTGLARALAEAHMVALSALPGLAPRSRSAMEALFNAQAAAIVDHITANAEVTVTITPSDSGLQRDPASSDPTLAPAADKVLTGTLT
jgi:hypothetical protein